MTALFLLACSSGDTGGTPVAGLKITPDSVTVAIGSTAQLTVTDLSGQAVSGVVWTSTDPTKATISSTGLVTAIAAGRIAVTASADGKQGSAIVRSAVATDFIVDAQVTQGTQSTDGSIPVVLGGNGAVVNVSVHAAQTAAMPVQLVLRLFDNANAIIRSDTVRFAGTYPNALTYGTPSAQFLIPASQLAAVTSWQVVRDPKGETPDIDPTNDVYPRSGRATLNKVTVPAFVIRLVPIVLAVNGGATGVVTTAQLPEYLRTAKSLHPLGTINATVGTSFSTQANFGTPPSGGGQAFWQQVLAELDLARVSDVNGDPNSYWMGILVPPSGFNFTQYGGFGYIPSSGGSRAAGTRTAVAVQIGWFARATQARDGVAHELGHNFGRAHAPCGGPASPDPSFPYGGGVIGVVGHDVFSWANGDAISAVSLSAQTGDLMGYCAPVWNSDYNYNKVLQFRGTTAASLQRAPVPVRSLIVRGRIEDNARVVLEPSFTVVARPTAPERIGNFQLTGRTLSGQLLFQYSFDAANLDHTAGVRHFLFAIPVTPTIDDSLATIEVTGAGAGAQLRATMAPAIRTPGSESVTVTSVGDGLAVTCGDRASRGILVRDASSGAMLGTASGSSLRIAATSGMNLSVICSDGVRSMEVTRAVP